jgi:hypothetical protein
MIKSTISLALIVLRRIRTEAAKETLATVKAVLPMDVANYLLNQKRKEIAHLEDEYNITVHLGGNPAARQNEYEIEFIRRELTVEPSPVVEKLQRRDSFEVPSAPVPSRDGSSERPEPLDKPVPPVIAEIAVEEAAPPPAVDLPLTPLAVARGRVFWRVAAASRRLELAQAVQALGAPSAQVRTGRSSSGRLMRRTRTWWRRRSPAPPASQAANKDDAPKVSNNLG